MTDDEKNEQWLKLHKYTKSNWMRLAIVQLMSIKNISFEEALVQIEESLKITKL